MVRIVGTKAPSKPKGKHKKKEPTSRRIDPSEMSSVLKLLGVAIVANPKAFIELLNYHNVSFKEGITEEELLELTLNELGKNRKFFKQDLAVTLGAFFNKKAESKYTGEDEEDHFISTLLPALGGVAEGLTGMIGQKQRIQADKEVARQQALSSMMQAKAQQQAALAAQVQAQSQASKPNNTVLYLMLGLTGLVGAGLAYMYFRNNQIIKSEK